MPNIFIGGTSIGGCNDGPGIMTLDNEGKLDGMIAEALAASAPAPAAPSAAESEGAPPAEAESKDEEAK